MNKEDVTDNDNDGKDSDKIYSDKIKECSDKIQKEVNDFQNLLPVLEKKVIPIHLWKYCLMDKTFL